jgi:hypothetical protein
MMIGLAGMLVAGVVGGAVVAFAVRGDDKARAELPAVAPSALIEPGRSRHLPTNNPQTALLEVWSLAQWGDIPRLLRLQDPTLRRAVGDQLLAGTYTHQRPRMATRRPRVLGADTHGQTATVRYRLQGDSPSDPQSAILRRHAGVWHVRYDTFIEDAIPFYVLAARGAAISPDRADRLAAARAATTYRAQASSLAPSPKRSVAQRAKPLSQSPPAPPNAPAASSPPNG